MWLITANGGLVRLANVIVLEPEMRNHNRWIVDAYLDSGSTFELRGEYESREEAESWILRLIERVTEYEAATAP